MRILKSLAVAAVGGVSVIYLLNPGAGMIELIPDALPVVGNLDEVFMTVVLLRCMKHFGIDVLGNLSRAKAHEPKPPPLPAGVRREG